ncbi:MAG: SDR family NAD(P)-dependent oxidoreductase [Acidimicrobiales bacterium]
MSDHSTNTALVTGANSGLGFEAAAQLAEMGYGRVTVACRSQEKADTAVRELVERTGANVFETLVVDVASIESSRKAASELASRSRSFDVVLLNAGMVPSRLDRTTDGIEMCFAASLIGHHIITTTLLDADLVDGASIVLVGSEAANNDLPRAMGMSVYDFVLGESSEFGSPASEAMRSFATASAGPGYNGQRQYSTTKAFSSWWSAAMTRKHDGSTRFYTVSPGANMGTNAARHSEGAFKFMIAFMSRFGRFVGMDQPIADGASRYLDVAHNVGGAYETGRTYTSKPKKMTGPLVVCEQAHLTNHDRQDTALDVITALTESN